METINDLIPNVPTLDVTLPSGNVVTIREQNGEDEDILSKFGDSQTLVNITKFLSRIVMEPKVTANDISHWKIRDKYYLLFKSRLFSLGEDLTFEYTFQGDDEPTPFIEDLGKFDWDLSSEEEPPKKGDQNYISQRISKYKSGSSIWHEFSLASERKCRFKYLTGIAEKKLLAYDKNDLSINIRLIVRDFQVFHNGDWVPIQRFNIFSSREMREIRKELENNDAEFELLVPLVKGEKSEVVSLFSLPDFFFPRD